MMLKLFKFQTEASITLAERFIEYHRRPLLKEFDVVIPFYQVLVSITGSGKTAILANSLEVMRAMLPLSPIVLWVSRGKVVVDQTLNGLQHGSYSSLLSNYDVKALLDLRQEDIESADRGLLLIATVGKFNQKDMQKSDRKVFRAALDSADDSLWEMLKRRMSFANQKRPLIVVYDEGHNLSDQQAQIIFDLNPDALIAATATEKVPAELSGIISRLKNDRKWNDEDFKVMIKSSDVVKSGLIKETVQVGGTTMPREQAIDEMLVEFDEIEKLAKEHGAGFKPKAIYITDTNFTKGIDVDDIRQPFHLRKASPIAIWRYLVEEKGIDPNEIAVYMDLKFAQKHQPPSNFHLFKGEDDYYKFIQGNYRHIIFNLTLQEGWDDPEVAFAYVDKVMKSTTQIAQVTGRVLRQPGARHYADPRLNTAHFFIRTDEKKTFEGVLAEIQKKIERETPEVSIIVANAKSGTNQKEEFPALKIKSIPEPGILSGAAEEKIEELLEDMLDYSEGGANTEGSGSSVRVLQKVGKQGINELEWVEVPHSSPVTVRWVLKQQLQLIEPRALELIMPAGPKFDAKIEYNSKAAKYIRQIAEEIANLYLMWSEVKVKGNSDLYTIPSIKVNPAGLIKYKNAIHAGYSDLNTLEQEFADSLDRTQRIWCRNPSRGYGIPMLDGKSEWFYPDFLVWVGNKDVVAIDPKGGHLIRDDASRKLLHLKWDGKGTNVHTVLVTEGEWDPQFNEKPGKNNGYTVWKLKDGKPMPTHCKNADEAVKVALQIN